MVYISCSFQRHISGIRHKFLTVVTDNRINQISSYGSTQQNDLLQIHSHTRDCAHVKNMSFSPQRLDRWQQNSHPALSDWINKKLIKWWLPLSRVSYDPAFEQKPGVTAGQANEPYEPSQVWEPDVVRFYGLVLRWDNAGKTHFSTFIFLGLFALVTSVFTWNQLSFLNSIIRCLIIQCVSRELWEMLETERPFSQN